MAGNLSSLGFGATIKSIQRGVISIVSASSQTATVSSVNTAKSELRLLGSTFNTASADPQLEARLSLTNATTITATRISSGGLTTTVSWELTEFY